MNLKTKFSLSYIALASLAAFSVGSITVLSERQLLKQEIEQHNAQLIRQLAGVCEESLYQTSLVFVNYVRTLRNERGFLAACFVDANGGIRFHSDPKLLDSKLEAPPSDVLDLNAPVFLAGEPVGTAHLFISQTRLQQFLNESLLKNVKRIGLITLVVLFISILFGLALARAMVAPIQQIVLGMREVSKGRLDFIAFPERTDELGWMANELNVTIDKLRELDEMKRDFVAGVTHDLKSPLKAIQSFVTRVFEGIEKYPATRQREYLQIIQNNANRLMDLIDDLLTSARLEAKREEIEGRNFDVGELTREVATLYEALIKEKNLNFSVSLPATPITIWGDREMIAQVLQNLVSNAIKFTPNGSITLEVKADQDHVTLTVADTGLGIPSSDREKIFDKFYRSRGSSSVAKGTGLGLFIVKGFVEAHHGTIRVTNNNEHGTKVLITLPSQRLSPNN